MIHLDQVKHNVGKKAAQLVEQEMLLGLGTGSTAKWAIIEIGKRIKEEGLKVQAVCTSVHSHELAKKEGIPLIDINTVKDLDLTLDGADEIDPFFCMIKGGGGALTREKIVASMSKEMVVLIDETKPVHFLGEKMPLPIEIIPFGKETTKKQIQALGLSGHFRMEHNTFFMTDNQNVILDTVLPQGMAIKELHGQIKALVGVVETGLFFDLAKKVLIGHTDGSVEIKLAP